MEQASQARSGTSLKLPVARVTKCSRNSTQLAATRRVARTNGKSDPLAGFQKPHALPVELLVDITHLPPDSGLSSRQGIAGRLPFKMPKVATLNIDHLGVDARRKLTRKTG